MMVLYEKDIRINFWIKMNWFKIPLNQDMKEKKLDTIIPALGRQRKVDVYEF